MRLRAQEQNSDADASHMLETQTAGTNEQIRFAAMVHVAMARASENAPFFCGLPTILLSCGAIRKCRIVRSLRSAHYLCLFARCLVDGTSCVCRVYGLVSWLSGDRLLPGTVI